MAITITPVSVELDIEDAEAIGMAFVHPHMCMTTNAPFRVVDQSRALAVSVAEASIRAAFEPLSGLPRVQFVVLPEFALTFESINVVETILSSELCPANTVVIAGVEWLSAEQYVGLLTSSANPEQMKQKRPDASLYVNCCLIWIKTPNGLTRFVQPKLRPSPPEASTQLMYRGSDILVFVSRGPNALTFAVLICFDCIAMEGDKPMFAQIIEAIPKSGPTSSFPLSMLFVPQFNDSPEHKDFINFAESFLTRGGMTINTADSAVAFVNAASTRHGRSESGFGRSSLFYRTGHWQSVQIEGPLARVPGTYAMETMSATLVRARLREDGACIHRFGFVLPWRVLHEPGSTRVPLIEARVRQIDSGASGAWTTVPGICKVFTDWITDDLADLDYRFRSTIDIAQEYSTVRLNLLEAADAGAERIGQILDLLLLGFGGYCCRPDVNPDSWQRPVANWRDDTHGQAITELAAVCSLLQLVGVVDARGDSDVATANLGRLLLVVLDGDNRRTHNYLLAKYLEWLKTHSWRHSVGKSTLIIMTRVSSQLLRSTIAEEVEVDIADLSANDEQILSGISGELSNPTEAITNDQTKVFKHFASILRDALDRETKAEAGQFVKECLGKAI
jgi:hypothetical protein